MGVVPVNSTTFIFHRNRVREEDKHQKYEIKRVNVKMSAGGRAAQMSKSVNVITNNEMTWELQIDTIDLSTKNLRQVGI